MLDHSDPPSIHHVVLTLVTLIRRVQYTHTLASPSWPCRLSLHNQSDLPTVLLEYCDNRVLGVTTKHMQLHGT
jgi:hypothetical protein